MFRLFPSVFTVEDVRKIREFLAQIEFVDGANTAGSWVGGKKHNLEASIQATADLGQQIIKVVTQHRGIAAWSVPTRAARPLFNCYREGDYYHRHEDNPVVSDIRADVSYTVFLTEPEEYEGGALVLRVGDETRSFKEPAGSVLVYDSGHAARGSTGGSRRTFRGGRLVAEWNPRSAASTPAVSVSRVCRHAMVPAGAMR